MSATATTADVERELIGAWQALASAVDSFSDGEKEQPGVVEGWSVEDLLGHIAFWSQRAAESLQLIAAGRSDEIRFPADVAAVDEWNEWLESFQQAKQALADFPVEKLEQKVKGQAVLRWFAIDTYEHFREHLAHLNTWRREVETTEA